jgi:hypothetical protein
MRRWRGWCCGGSWLFRDRQRLPTFSSMGPMTDVEGTEVIQTDQPLPARVVDADIWSIKRK